MGKIKYVVLVLMLTLTSCGVSLWGEWPKGSDDIGDIDNPYTYGIKWKAKKYDYDYEPWEYVNEIRCGWRYDGWLNDIEYVKPDICTYVCEERPKFEHKNDLFPTFQECLHFDYTETQ